MFLVKNTLPLCFFLLFATSIDAAASNWPVFTAQRMVYSDDPLFILGLTADDLSVLDPDEQKRKVKEAYRRQLKTFHPDHAPPELTTLAGTIVQKLKDVYETYKESGLASLGIIKTQIEENRSKPSAFTKVTGKASTGKSEKFDQRESDFDRFQSYLHNEIFESLQQKGNQSQCIDNLIEETKIWLTTYDAAFVTRVWKAEFERLDNSQAHRYLDSADPYFVIALYAVEADFLPLDLRMKISGSTYELASSAYRGWDKLFVLEQIEQIIFPIVDAAGLNKDFYQLLKEARSKANVIQKCANILKLKATIAR